MNSQKLLPPFHRSSPLALVGSIAVLIAAQSAHASSSTWSTSPVSANWNAINWAGTDNPPLTGDALIFGESTQTTLNNDLTTGAAWIIPSITFSSGSPAYTISGNAFTLGTATASTVITNSGASLQTLNDNITLANAAQTIALTAGGGDVTLNGVISGAGTSSGITLIGAGTLTLMGSNTYSGNTKISGGILSVSSDSNLGTGALTLNGGTLKITGVTAFSTTKGITFNAGTTSTIDVSNSAGATIAAIGGSGNLVKTGTGTLTLSTANNSATWGGTTTISSGTLVLGASWALANTFNSSGAGTLSFGSLTSAYLGGLMGTGTITLPSGVTLSAGANTSSTISFAGSFVGAGNLTVTGNYSGNKLAVYTGTSSIGGTFNVASGGTLQINGGSFTTSGAWGNSGAGTVQVTNGGSFSIGTDMAGAKHYVIQDSGYVSLGTSASSLDQYLYLTTTGGTATLKGSLYQGLNIDASGTAVVNILANQSLVVNDANNNGWLKVGGNAAVTLSGTLDLAANTTASGTIALNGGVLTLPGLKKTNTTSVTTVNFNGGTLKLSGSTTLASTVNTTFNVLTGGAVIDTQSYNITENQALVSGTTGDGGLTKLGSGNLTLGAVNTYTGATTVTSGTLTLASAGSINNSSTINVASGAVLDLTGKTSGYHILSGQTVKGKGTLNLGAGNTLTVDSGAHWAPGNSIGTNSVTGNLSLAAGSATDIELGRANAVATASLNDSTTVTGVLKLDGTLNLIDNAGANSQGSAGAGSYLVFTGATSVSGAFSSVNNVSGYHAKVDSTSTTGSVYINNYQIASANTQPSAVNLGITHVGESFTNTALNIQNTGTNNGFSEGLNATKSATTGAATLAGSNVSNLAGGSTSTAITVGLNDTATAGAKTGTATVGFASNGSTTSGYGNTTLIDQTVTVNGQVNYYADPTLSAVSGGNLTATDTTHYTLSLGSYNLNTGEYTATISLNNFLHDATYQDLLSGTFDTSAKGLFSLEGFTGTLEAITSGSSVTLTVSFDTQSMTSGTYTGSILFNPTSANTSGTSSLAQLSLGLEFEVVPEPATWSMIVGGLGIMTFVQRARRRMNRQS